MIEVPLDAKILIEQFKAQEKQEQARRALEKQQKPSGGDFADSDRRKPMRAKEVQRYARRFGFLVEDGNGRHGIHLVAPNGSECPLPVHGGGRTLANGTQRSIVNFINQNGTIRG